MPKCKTRRAAAKRLTVKASGNVKFQRTKRRHLLTHRSKDTKRELRMGGHVAAVDVPRLHACLPHSF